ncbi:putative disease resistance protein RGA3 isoform X1 [Typha latifolia]|uniref:putative disease resistance protein RGA3 isoform X1 n=1 Tax=Typha latifolia TaxID=4733 RepID=UPI003C2DDDE5
MARALLSSIVTLGAKLVAAIQISGSVEDDLNWTVSTLKGIQATLLDAEEREIREESVKLWLKELREVAYAAEDVLDDYHYEVMRTKAEARTAAVVYPSKRKRRFGEVCVDLEALHLREEEAQVTDFVTKDSLRKRKIVQVGSSSPSHSLPVRALVPEGMAEKVRAIRSRFDEINKDREKLRLREEDGKRRPHAARYPPPTGHFVDKSSVFGRTKEKEEVIELLLSDHDEPSSVSVIAIVGKGGLGKTTLAKLVYNDPRVCQSFDRTGWVSVSEDFDVRRLTKATIESVSQGSCPLTELSALQGNLMDLVRGEKVLLVLDDVWNEQHSDWELLQAPLLCAKMVKILVTTRNDGVAVVMQTLSPYRLGYLPEGQCWALFQHYAFGGMDCVERSNLVKIGKEIVSKCGGLPLAVKSLASLLRFEVDEDCWIEILESEEWQSDVDNETFVALRISYQRMPSYLKPCFRFCSMFPKNYQLSKTELTRLWIAQGYVQSNSRKTMEEIGTEYVDELMRRSFIDHLFDRSTLYGEEDSTYEMHDLIHELGRLMSEREHFAMIDGKMSDPPAEVHHLFVKNNVETVLSGNLMDLRTLILTTDDDKIWHLGDLAKIQCLRALELTVQFIKLPESIGNLKHLRYLFLYHSEWKRLPPSICLLYNLQILVLAYCSLVDLPEGIGNLNNLQHLIIAFSKIERLPESIRLLSNLQKLIIRYSDLHELPEGLGNLVDLRYLAVCCCQIEVLPESVCQLNSLHTLILTGCKRLRELPSCIGELGNLQNLNILGSGVRDMPLWIHKLVALQILEASFEVRRDSSHGALGLLRDLDNLKGSVCISGLENMVDSEDAKNANLKSKWNINELTLSWPTAFTRYFEETSRYLQFKLEVSKDGGADRLVGTEMDGLMLECLQPHPSLKRLNILGYRGNLFPRWMGDPSSCTSIESVLIESCQHLRSLPFCNLHSVSSLTIVGCHELQFLPQECLPSKLQILHIQDCLQLKLLTGLQNLMSLNCLNIHKCAELQISPNETLPPKLKIKHVKIIECPRLTDWCQLQSIKYYSSEEEIGYSLESDEDGSADATETDSNELSFGNYSSEGDSKEEIGCSLQGDEDGNTDVNQMGSEELYDSSLEGDSEDGTD